MFCLSWNTFLCSSWYKLYEGLPAFLPSLALDWCLQILTFQRVCTFKHNQHHQTAQLAAQEDAQDEEYHQEEQESSSDESIQESPQKSRRSKKRRSRKDKSPRKTKSSSNKRRRSKSNSDKENRRPRKHKNREEDLPDQHPDREDLPTDLYTDKELQRANNHPSSMAPTLRKTSRKGSKGAKKKQVIPQHQRKLPRTRNDNESDDEGSVHSDVSEILVSDRDKDLTDDDATVCGLDTKGGNQDQMKRMREQAILHKLELYATKAEADGTKYFSKGGTKTEDEDDQKKGLTERQKVTYNHVRVYIWPFCKFFLDENKVEKACRILLTKFVPTELQELEGKALEQGKDLWVRANKPLVMWCVSHFRNYTSGQVERKLKAVFEANKEDQYPNLEDIRMLNNREGLAKKGEDLTALDHKMVLYHDEMIPLVAMDKAWPKRHRHNGTLSAYAPLSTPSNPNPKPYIHPSTEALLRFFYEQHWEKWVAAFLKKRNSDDDDAGAAEEETEATAAKEDPKFTNPKAGRAKFAGWTDLGIQKFNEWTKEVVEARKHRDTKAIEQYVLERVRCVHFGCNSHLQLLPFLYPNQLFLDLLLPFIACRYVPFLRATGVSFGGWVLFSELYMPKGSCKCHLPNQGVTCASVDWSLPRECGAVMSLMRALPCRGSLFGEGRPPPFWRLLVPFLF